MSAPNPETIAVVVLAVPFAWTAAMAVLRRGPAVETPDDTAEKRQLLILVAPVVLGAVLLGLAPLLPTGVVLPATGLDDIGRAMVAPASAVAEAGRAATVQPLPVIHWLAIVALVICAGGAMVQVSRLVATLLRLHRVVAGARADTAWGDDVRLTPRAIPPLVWGAATIVLPENLLVFSPERIDMILRHERAHLRRGDAWYFILLAVLDALIWFNPFVRAQTRRCRLAAELACDSAVTQAEPASRTAYAELLVDALKHGANASPTPMPTVVPSEEFGDYHMRLNAILRPAAGPSRSKRRWQYALITLAALPVAAAQFAWSQTGAAPARPAAQRTVAAVVATPDQSQPAAPAAASTPDIKPQSPGNYRTVPQKAAKAPDTTETVQFTFVPVNGERTTGFGVRLDPYTHEPRLHPGQDFYVPVGTAVLAAAPGTVSFVGVRDGYGEVVEIDHGNNTTSRYAHLDSAEVTAGNFVAAGQEIAKSGSSGRSTGPHLHFEVWKNSVPVDPAKLLPAA